MQESVYTSLKSSLYIVSHHSFQTPKHLLGSSVVTGTWHSHMLLKGKEQNFKTSMLWYFFSFFHFVHYFNLWWQKKMFNTRIGFSVFVSYYSFQLTSGIETIIPKNNQIGSCLGHCCRS